MHRIFACLLLCIALGAAACGGRSDSATPSPSTATSTTAANATPSATPTSAASSTPPTPAGPVARQFYPALPASARSGDPAIDAVLAAFEGADVDALVALTGFESYRCEGEKPVQPHPKRCPEGVSEGTVLQGFPISHVEGRYLRPAELAAFYADRVAGWQGWLYGVYQPPGDPAAAWIVFAPPAPYPRWFDHLTVRDGLIGSVGFAFSDIPLDALFDPSVSLWLLPPRAVVPAATFAFARDVADRVAAGELRTIMAEGRRTTWHCSPDGYPELPGGLIAQYSSLCEGAAGATREGFPFAVHGSHGGPSTVDEMVALIDIGQTPGPWKLLTVGCPLADFTCSTFAVAFGTGDGDSLRAMYLVFDDTTSPPVFTGAGVSGDNAYQIVASLVTQTVSGEMHFYPVPAR